VRNDADFSIHGQFQILLDILGEEISPEVRSMLVEASRSRKEAVPIYFDEHGNRAFAKEGLLDMLRQAARNKQRQNIQQMEGSVHVPVDRNWPGTEGIKTGNGEFLPTWIRFPYARHSSLEELRNFVKAFRPHDIYQCVLDEETWAPDRSVQALFGQFCSGREFLHDVEMMTIYERRLADHRAREQRIREMELESQRRELLMGATQHPHWLMGQIHDEWNTRHAEGRNQKESSVEQLPSVRQSEMSAACASPLAHRAEIPASPPTKEQPIRERASAMARDHSSASEQLLVSRRLSLHTFDATTPGLPSGFEIQRQLSGEACTSAAPRTSHQSFDTPMSTIAAQPPGVCPSHSSGRLNPGRYKYHSHGSSYSNKRRKLDPNNSTADESSPSLQVFNEYETNASEEDLPTPKKDGTSRFSHGAKTESLHDILASTKMLVDDAICLDAEEDAMARDRVEDAVLAAMGIGGMNWWSVELQSTREQRKLEKEQEL
jgi:hypothetical protein